MTKPTTALVSRLVLALLVLLALWRVQDALAPGLLVSGDSLGHAAKTHFLQQALLTQGRWDGWFPQWHGGFQLHQFYPPGFYLVTALLGFLPGLGFDRAFNGMAVLAYILLPVSFYLASRLLGLNRGAALTAAALGLTVDTWAGGGLMGGFYIGLVPQSWGLLIAPMALVAWLRLGEAPTRGRIALAAALSATIVWTHTFTGTSLLLVIAAVAAMAAGRRQWDRLVAVGVAVAVTAAITAAWWLPALVKRAYFGQTNPWDSPPLLEVIGHLLDGSLLGGATFVWVGVAALALLWRKGGWRTTLGLYTLLLMTLALGGLHRLVPAGTVLASGYFVRYQPLLGQAFILLSACLLDEYWPRLARRLPRRWAVPLVALTLVSLWAATDGPGFRRRQLQPIRTQASLPAAEAMARMAAHIGALPPGSRLLGELSWCTPWDLGAPNVFTLGLPLYAGISDLGGGFPEAIRTTVATRFLGESLHDAGDPIDDLIRRVTAQGVTHVLTTTRPARDRLASCHFAMPLATEGRLQLWGLRDASGPLRLSGPGAVKILDVQPEVMRFQIGDGPAGRVASLAVNAYPNWHASWNSAPIAWTTTADGFMAVRLPQGSGDLTWTFAWAPWEVAIDWLSGISAFGLVVLPLRRTWRRTGRTAPLFEPPRRVELVAIVTITGFLVLQAVLAVHRAYDADEWLTMHGAWSIAQGLVPYRDYFEHHAPLWHLILSGLARSLHPETSAWAAVATLTATRLWLVTWYGLALALTWQVVRHWRDAQTAWVATALLATHATYGEKMLEIRPDVPFQVFWLGALLALSRALEPTARRRTWVVAGACLGAALATSFKLLVAGPALTAGLALALWPRIRQHGWRPVGRDLGWLTVGLAVPLVPLGLWFAGHGALGAFWHANGTLNLGWRFHDAPWAYLGWVVVRNPLFTALALAGLVGVGVRPWHRTEGTLRLWTIGTMAGVAAMPVVQRQEYLLFLPLLALQAATALISLATVGRPRREVRWAIGCGVLIVVAAAGLWGLDPVPFCVGIEDIDLWRGPALAWVALTAATFIALLIRPGRLAAVVTVVLASAVPVAASALGATNVAQHTMLARMMALTSPTDAVLDGWRGYGVFRPQAWYYGFLHEEIRSLLGDAQRQALANDLASGHLAPKLALLDSDLLAVSPDVKRQLRAWYRPTDPVDGLIGLRRRTPLPDRRLPAAQLAERTLAALWQQPGTQAAAVTVPAPIGADNRADLTAMAKAPPVMMATWRLAGPTWHVGIRMSGDLALPAAKLVAAMPVGPLWQELDLVGRQLGNGDWETSVTLPTGASVPSWFLVRPPGWRDWFVVGLPVAFASGSPAKPDGTLVVGTYAVPSEAFAGPMNLPGNRGWSPWEAGEPWRVPPRGLAWGLNATVVYTRVHPGQIVQARSDWSPLAQTQGGTP